MPGIRGFWPLSNFGTTGGPFDVSGHDFHLTYNGDPLFLYGGLAGFCRFDGTGDYFTILNNAGLSITATEAYVDPSYQGLTLWCWARPTVLTAEERLVSKWHTNGQYSYKLSIHGGFAGDPVTFQISDDGAAGTSVIALPTTINEWQFIAGRFNDNDAGEELAVFCNDDKDTAAAAEADIFDGTDSFSLGGSGGGWSLITWDMALAGISCMALTDAMIRTIYHQTRALFGL